MFVVRRRWLVVLAALVVANASGAVLGAVFRAAEGSGFRGPENLFACVAVVGALLATHRRGASGGPLRVVVSAWAVYATAVLVAGVLALWLSSFSSRDWGVADGVERFLLSFGFFGPFGPDAPGQISTVVWLVTTLAELSGCALVARAAVGGVRTVRGMVRRYRGNVT